MHEIPVPFHRRHAAAGGVQMLNDPHHFEFGHIVANRSGGKTEIIPLGERLRSDSLAGATVLLNDQPENCALAIGERMSRHIAAYSNRLLTLRHHHFLRLALSPRE